MAAFGYTNTNCSNCCSMAAVCSSAPMIPILDTAVFLAVSVCVLPLLRIIVQAA